MDGLNFYIELDAADSDRELRNKYKNFEAHIDIYEATVNAYISLGRVLSAQEFTRNPERAFYYATSREWMQKLGGNANRLNNYMAVGKNYIETRVSMPDIPVVLSYRDQNRLQSAERILRDYFPGFQVPRTFKKTNPSIGRQFEIGDALNEMLSVERLSRVQPKFTPGFETEDATKGFKLAKNYGERGFNGIGYLSITMHLEDVRLEDPNSRSFGLPDTGSLLTGYTAYVRISVEAVYRWPMEFAKWVTCTGEGDEFVPFMFFQYINSHRAAYLQKRTRGGGFIGHLPARVNHLGKIVEMMQAENKQGRKPKVRTNDDGFLVLGAGEPAQLGAVLWVPNVNNVNDYMNQIKSCYNAQESMIDLSKFRMGGVPVLTDPNNEKFTYVRESGARGSADISGLITFDLTGSVPLDPTTIYRYLNTKLSLEENSEDLKQFIGGLYDYSIGKMTGASSSTDVFATAALQKMGFDSFDARKGTMLVMDALDFFLTNPDCDIRWQHFYGGNPFKLNLTGISYEENAPELKQASEGVQNKVRRTRAYLELIFQVSQRMLRDLDALKIGFASKVEFWRFRLYLASNYCRDVKDLAEQYQDKILLNSARPYMASEVLNPKGLVIPNMPGLKKALPHQVECMLDLHMEPEMTLLEADVGGGKGMMGPAQALMYLQKGLIKRPLFLVPGRLVSNWTNEIGKYCQGQVNPFPITLPIVRRLQRVYQGEKGQATKPNYDFLRKIIDACPVNTFFISSFNFLVADEETITYGNAEAKRYYAAEFFRDLGIFDLVVLDESHYVKNLSSRATVAASIVTSPAKYKTEMSGTIVSNTLMDLVGQSAIGNPSALGNSKRFAKNYALMYTGRGGTISVSEWRPDAAAMIVHDMKPYAKRIIKKKDRWAFILPHTNELFHTTHMTTNQQDFYNYMLNSKLEELKNKNPALYQKMLDGNEKDEDAIAFGLDNHFQTLEAFIGAPDMNEDFVKIQGLSEDDLTSAKLKETIKILDGHFNGYTDDEGKAIPPSQFKVIIFAARIPTVKHFESRMPDRYKKMMAVYYAGQEQALEAFKSVPGIKILLAAEMSANTGQNFQVGSRMIRTEALFAPGGQVQAAGRIDRPDFDNRGRDEIFLDWIMVNKTMDVVKIARIISKNVEKMKYDRQEDPYFVARPFQASQFVRDTYSDVLPLVKRDDITIEKMFASLPLVKLNTDTFLKVNDARQLAQYFASYALILDFNNQQYAREKKEGLHELIPITDDMRAMLPGSKKIDFMPRIPNVDPQYFDLKNEYGFKPISRLQMEMDLQKMGSDDDEPDEESANYEDVNPVDEGDIVDTEFGIGSVVKILKNTVWVDIKGFKKVQVLKACAWLITNEEKLDQIKRDLARGKTFVRRLPGADQAVVTEEPMDDNEANVAPPALPAPKPEPERPGADMVAPEEPAVDDFDKAEQDEAAPAEGPAIDIFPYIIDGEFALTSEVVDEKVSQALIDQFGFSHFASYYAIQVKTLKGLNTLLSVLESKFSIDPKIMQSFEPYKTLLKNPAALDSATATNFRNVVQFFKVQMHRRLQRGQLRPFPIVFGKNFFVAIDQISTPSYSQALQAIRSAAIPGVKILPRRQDDVHVRFFPTAAAAAAAAREVNQTIPVANMKAYKDENGDTVPSVFSLLQEIRRRPMINTVPKTPAPAPAAAPKQPAGMRSAPIRTLRK